MLRSLVLGVFVAAVATTADCAAHAQSLMVPGWLNTRTLAFQPRVSMAPSSAATAYSGVFDVTITVSVVSSVPTTQAIVCLVEIDAEDSNFNLYQQQASAVATRSGETATCTLTVPYSWALGTTPVYTFNHSVTTTATSGNPSRTASYYPQASSAVPANGATTKLTASVTL